jgi:hypothetical protein
MSTTSTTSDLPVVKVLTESLQISNFSSSGPLGTLRKANKEAMSEEILIVEFCVSLEGYTQKDGQYLAQAILSVGDDPKSPKGPIGGPKGGPGPKENQKGKSKKPPRFWNAEISDPHDPERITLVVEFALPRDVSLQQPNNSSEVRKYSLEARKYSLEARNSSEARATQYLDALEPFVRAVIDIDAGIRANDPVPTTTTKVVPTLGPLVFEVFCFPSVIYNSTDNPEFHEPKALHVSLAEAKAVVLAAAELCAWVRETSTSRSDRAVCVLARDFACSVLHTPNPGPNGGGQARSSMELCCCGAPEYTCRLKPITSADKAGIIAWLGTHWPRGVDFAAWIGTEPMVGRRILQGVNKHAKAGAFKPTPSSLPSDHINPLDIHEMLAKVIFFMLPIESFLYISNGLATTIKGDHYAFQTEVRFGSRRGDLRVPLKKTETSVDYNDLPLKFMHAIENSVKLNDLYLSLIPDEVGSSDAGPNKDKNYNAGDDATNNAVDGLENYFKSCRGPPTGFHDQRQGFDFSFPAVADTLSAFRALRDAKGKRKKFLCLDVRTFGQGIGGPSIGGPSVGGPDFSLSLCTVLFSRKNRAKVTRGCKELAPHYAALFTKHGILSIAGAEILGFRIIDLALEVLAQERLAQKRLAQERLAQEILAQEGGAQEDLAREDVAQEHLSQEDLAPARQDNVDVSPNKKRYKKREPKSNCSTKRSWSQLLTSYDFENTPGILPQKESRSEGQIDLSNYIKEVVRPVNKTIKYWSENSPNA